MAPGAWFESLCAHQPDQGVKPRSSAGREIEGTIWGTALGGQPWPLVRVHQEPTRRTTRHGRSPMELQFGGRIARKRHGLLAGEKLSGSRRVDSLRTSFTVGPTLFAAGSASTARC
jgi:hypothetical protein